MKTALITGANTGMGYATTVALAKQNMRVVMLCRSRERGEEARKKAVSESGSQTIALHIVDLSSFKSIQEAAEQLKVLYPVIDIMINNAGVVTTKKEYTKDGFEKMMGVNYLGHFLLTNLLLPNMEAADAGRIVVVSSGAYKFSPLYLDDFNSDQRFSIWKNYGRSKLANLLFARELARRLSRTNVTVNALHPGAVATSLGVNRDTGFGKSITALLKPFFRSAEKGAETAVYLATSEEVKDITGEYFYNKKIKATKGEANNLELAEQLWQKSEVYTELATKA